MLRFTQITAAKIRNNNDNVNDNVNKNKKQKQKQNENDNVNDNVNKNVNVNVNVNKNKKQKQKQNENDNVNDNENVNDNVNDNVNEKSPDAVSRGFCFVFVATLSRFVAALLRLTYRQPSVASGDSLPFVGPQPHSVATLKTPVASVATNHWFSSFAPQSFKQV